MEGEMEIVEGHGRLYALKLLGRDECPVIFLDHLTDDQRRAYALAHNQLTLSSGYDPDALFDELQSIADIDMTDFGFDTDVFTADEIDALLDFENDGDAEAAGRPKTAVCPYCGHENMLEG